MIGEDLGVTGMMVKERVAKVSEGCVGDVLVVMMEC